MKVFRLFIIGVCAFFSVAASAQQPSQPFLFGMWEGTLNIVQDRGEGAPQLPPFQTQQLPLRLDIRNTNLVIYFSTPNGWVGMGEGSDLRLNEQGRSAIVVASIPAGEQMETWMLNIARWDEENLAVHVSRVTSGNASQPPSSFSAFGQMMKVPK